MSKLPDLAALRKLVAASACEEKRAGHECAVCQLRAARKGPGPPAARVPSWHGALGPTTVPGWSGLEPLAGPISGLQWEAAFGPASLPSGIFTGKHSQLEPGRDQRVRGTPFQRRCSAQSGVSWCFDIPKGSEFLLTSLCHSVPGPGESQMQALQEPNNVLFGTILWLIFK